MSLELFVLNCCFCLLNIQWDRLLLYASSFGFIGGIWTLFPVFGLYSPPFICSTTESEMNEECNIENGTGPCTSFQ